jgi:integrase
VEISVDLPGIEIFEAHPRASVIHLDKAPLIVRDGSIRREPLCGITAPRQRVPEVAWHRFRHRKSPQRSVATDANVPKRNSPSPPTSFQERPTGGTCGNGSQANPRQPNVVHLDSGAGLANATILLRLSVIRLFFDYLVEEGLRSTNPAGRMQWRRRYGRTPGEAPLVRRHRRLPWIPTEEQWQALLAVMQNASARTRLMFALSYDAALRRHELLTLDTTDIDPAHRLIRIRAEHAKNRCERVVPYSAPTAQLYTS